MVDYLTRPKVPSDARQRLGSARIPDMNAALTGFTWLLVLQLAGEAVVRLSGVPLPGPIVGFVLALGALRLAPPLRAPLRAAADALLPHLSLLFIPAGVGVVMYLGAIREDALAIGAALVVSTLGGLAATAWVAERVARWQDGQPTDRPTEQAKDRP